MIELRNITAGYGGTPVLQDVCLELRPGKVTVLIGPNGCGKSTLLRVAARQLTPERGGVWLDGDGVSGLSTKEFARHVALLPQGRSVPEISVGALVLHGRFPYLGYPRRYRPEDRQAARKAMEQTGVLELEHTMVSQLSGGQRQKAYLAMAVAQDTPYLLLDEPTTYLDISHQLELVELARKLARQGKGVVMVLHDLNLALTWGDMVAVMEHGRIMRTGTPDAVFESGVLERVFGVRVHQTVLENGQTQYLFSNQ